MRNPIHFVAAIRKLVALANVAILAVERFAASFKPDVPQLCCAMTCRYPRRWRRYRSGGSSERHGQLMPSVRSSGMGNGASGFYQLPEHHGIAQGS